jgi:hypothetical protein
LVPVPPRFAPPLLVVVEEVPGGFGFVAPGEVPVGLVVVVVGLVVVVVGLVVVVVGDVLVVVGAVVVGVVVVVLLQALAASWLTVLAAWLRFCERVVLTEAGRLVTALVRAAEALLAWPQLWALIALETESSWLLRLLAWSDESRPLLLPQATAKAAANPRPPARNAREPKPIRRLSLAGIPGPGVASPPDGRAILGRLAGRYCP